MLLLRTPSAELGKFSSGQPREERGGHGRQAKAEPGTGPQEEQREGRAELSLLCPYPPPTTSLGFPQ